MGACMNLPTLALVTSMCKGLTLYTHLHLRKDKFSMNKTVIIAQQISQVSVHLMMELFRQIVPSHFVVYTGYGLPTRSRDHP